VKRIRLRRDIPIEDRGWVILAVNLMGLAIVPFAELGRSSAFYFLAIAGTSVLAANQLRIDSDKRASTWAPRRHLVPSVLRDSGTAQLVRDALLAGVFMTELSIVFGLAPLYFAISAIGLPVGWVLVRWLMFRRASRAVVRPGD
jgi:hypothetical protein